MSYLSRSMCSVCFVLSVLFASLWHSDVLKIASLFNVFFLWGKSSLRCIFSSYLLSFYPLYTVSSLSSSSPSNKHSYLFTFFSPAAERDQHLGRLKGITDVFNPVKVLPQHSRVYSVITPCRRNMQYLENSSPIYYYYHYYYFKADSIFSALYR